MATAAAALVQLVAYGAAFLHPKLQPKLDSKLESKPDLKKGDQDFSTTWPKALCSPPVFCLALAAVLVAGRWEWLKVDRPLNPDEGLFLASAWRYTQDIVPWRATNSGTSGPMTPWLLAGLHILGAALSYANAHTVALCLQIVLVCLAYSTIRIVCGEVPARLATMPTALLLSRTGDLNFIHLSSENVPLVLMVACGWAAAHGLQGGRAEGRSRWLLCVAGLLAGAVPFAKLQAAPMAVIESCVVVIAIVAATSSRGKRFARLIWFCIGGITVPIVITGMVVSASVLSEMWQLYIGSNLVYANHAAAERSFATRAVDLIWCTPVFLILCGGGVVMAGVAAGGCVFMGWGRKEPHHRWLLFASFVYLAIGLFCVAKSGHHFPHYLLLLALPLMLISGVALQLILSAEPARFRLWAGVGLACVTPFVVLSNSVLAGNWYIEGSQPARILAMLLQMPSSSESNVVAQLTDSHDEVAVWGWRPDIYVEARRKPAVRDVEPSQAIVPGPFRDVVRRRFLEDMQRNRPRLFVDAVCYAGFPADDWQVFGKEIVERRLGGHETFAELGEFVSRHYVRRAQVFKGPNGSGGSVRVYERRDAVPR
jgi:hypothetical protein